MNELKLDFDEKQRLVELLLKCPSIQDTEICQMLLKELPFSIATAIEISNHTKMHVLNIVNTCINHADGLNSLLLVLKFFDGETTQFHTLKEFVNSLLNQDSTNGQISSSIFKYGGALEENSPVYIERQAEGNAIRCLRAMDYLMFIEPRQQGKTSIIFNLKSHPALSNYVFPYVYFNISNKVDEQRWFETIGRQILEHLNKCFDCQSVFPPEDSSDWRKFLKNIATQAQENDRYVVIALDEVSAVPLEWSDPFFSVMRDIFNSRVVEPEFKHLSFIIAGAYNPRDLIKDIKVSPFNIAHRIRLDDFNFAETRQLVSKGGWHVTASLAERIHTWTSGQPYLTQLLCSNLRIDATPEDVNACVERLCREDENHIPSLLKRLEADAELYAYLKKILRQDERYKFHPQVDRRHTQLELLGFIKPDGNGDCVIRNQIYEEILKSFYSIEKHQKEYPIDNKGEHSSEKDEPPSFSGNSWAVLVGVNQYKDKAAYRQLHVCVKDVHAIHEHLIAGKFKPSQTFLLTDDVPKEDLTPTRDNILTQLKVVADNTEPDDLLLFYYSGHGDERDRESYLVTQSGKQVSLQDTAISIFRVKEIMNQAPARKKVIILDACHSGADIGGKGVKVMSETFISHVFEQAEGLAILASCKQGQLSHEWHEQERSVFTHFLLEALSGKADKDGKHFVTVQDVNQYVVNGVKEWATQNQRSQTPTYESKVVGEIVLLWYD